MSSGDEVNEELITKVFLLSNERQYYFRELVRNMPEDEAGFLALHIINAELGTDMEQKLNK